MEKKVINSEKAPKAIGPYSQAIAIGDWLFCSGQLALDPETGKLTGDTAAEQAVLSLKNLSHVLEAAGMTASNVVKTTLFLQSMDDFAAVNEVWKEFFTGDHPARVTVEVSRLPAGALVEVEAVAAK